MATKADRYEGIDGLKAYAIIGIALIQKYMSTLFACDVKIRQQLKSCIINTSHTFYQFIINFIFLILNFVYGIHGRK